MAEESLDVSSNYGENNFLFGLNDDDFSDRILRLEIIPEDDFNGEKPLYFDKNIVYSQDSNSCCDGFKHTTLRINSIILAAKSPFFYKLFKNGMRESQNKTNVSLTIKKSEEASVIDLVNFMYGNTSISTSVQNLVNLLISADKFEVLCCMRFCVDMLLKLPMSPESALLYLDLHSSILVNDIVKPLIDAAKQYMANFYCDFTNSREELIKQPLYVIEAVPGRGEGVLVNSEDDVYDFILEWSREFYPEQEERREVMSKHLVPLIAFVNMSCQKLKEVLLCPDFEYEQVSKLVMEALFSKVEQPWLQPINVSNKLFWTPQLSGLSRRIYSPSCVVSFDLNKDDLRRLPPSCKIHSKSFWVGGTRFHLSAFRYEGKEEEGNPLALHMYEVDSFTSRACTFDYEFAVMDKPSNKFQNKFKIQNHTFHDTPGYGTNNLLGMTWTELISGSNGYFINGYLQVLITLKTS